MISVWCMWECVGGVYTMAHGHGPQRTTLCNWLTPPTFSWVTNTKVRLTDMGSNYLMPWAISLWFENKKIKIYLSSRGWLSDQKFHHSFSIVPDSLYLSLILFCKVSWEKNLNTHHGHVSPLFFRNQSTHEIMF